MRQGGKTVASHPTAESNGPQPEPIDVNRLMAEIRRRVAEKRAKGVYTVDALAANALDETAPLAPEELERLRDLAVQRVDFTTTASTKPLIGNAVRFVKYRLTRAVSQPLYALAAHSSQFNAGILGYAARTAREAAALRADLDIVTATARGATDRAAGLEQALSSTRERLGDAERHLAVLMREGLHERVSRLERRESGAPLVVATGTASPGSLGLLGVVIESRDWSDEDVARWAKHLGARDGVVLHLGSGSGRGLAGLGAGAVGVDDDPQLVAAAHEEDRPVTCADPIEYSASLGAESLDGAVLTGLVERLDGARLAALATGLARALSPGAPLVIDALDPTADGILTAELWRDPRRIRPLHYDAVVAVIEAAGLSVTDVEQHDRLGRYVVRATR